MKIILVLIDHWMCPPRFGSLFPQFKLRRTAGHNMFGHSRGRDDLFDDGDFGGFSDDLFGGLDFNFW